MIILRNVQRGSLSSVNYMLFTYIYIYSFTYVDLLFICLRIIRLDN
jgi:hypothetical protein